MSKLPWGRFFVGAVCDVCRDDDVIRLPEVAFFRYSVVMRFAFPGPAKFGYVLYFHLAYLGRVLMIGERGKRGYSLLEFLAVISYTTTMCVITKYDGGRVPY